MLNVYLTSDVEIWCNGWSNLDAKFPSAFNRYIYGVTKQGEFGLPYQVRELRRRNLTANFFIEPLFSYRFGLKYLQEIVHIVREQEQNIELHLHTEWVDEISPPLIADSQHKRQHLRFFTRQEQTELIQAGKQQLESAGADSISAFRAGSFAFNHDTLHALASNDIFIDSSYNACQFGPSSGVIAPPGNGQSFQTECITEFPMSVFQDGFGRQRHAQLTACSFSEIESVLWQALHQGQKDFVFLFHNFELLNPAHTDRDPICIKRFQQLLDFLETHREQFPTRSFKDAPMHTTDEQQGLPLKTAFWKTTRRYAEQLYRRRYH